MTTNIQTNVPFLGTIICVESGETRAVLPIGLKLGLLFFCMKKMMVVK
jgi:hypothetical protein